MIRPRSVLLVLVTLCALVAAGCGGGGDKVPSDAIAVVGGEQVPKSDYDALIHRAQVSYKARKQPFPAAGTVEYQQLKNQAIQILTQRVEFEQKAKDLGIKITDKQVNDRLEQLKKQFFGGNEKQYQAQLKKSGLDEEDLKKDIRSQLISEAIFNKVTANVTVSDKEIEAYYNSHKAQYKTPETREVLHILVAKKELADKLYDQLVAGADWAKLAKKYSIDPGSKDKGGRYTVVRGQTVAPFDQTAFLLAKGRTSRPFKSDYGYHIIRPISDIKPASTTPLKEAKETIRQTLLQERKNSAMSKWVEKTRREYAKKIEYQVGFKPPATTSTTTQ